MNLKQAKRVFKQVFHRKTATLITGNDTYVGVQYHNTEVVKYTGDKVYFNSGGRRTNTTKVRINMALSLLNTGIQVVQQQGNWYLTNGMTTSTDKMVKFVDNDYISI